MINYSFEQFCIDNNYNELLELWDYKLNDISPNLVSSTTNKKYWLKCPDELHESRMICIGNVVKGYKKRGYYCICHACNSIGQYIIDKYGLDYLNMLWSDKNEKSYFDIDRSSKNKIWLRCLDNPNHDDFDVAANNYSNGHDKCPYCTGQRVCLTNSFGYKHPEYVEVWSDKNLFGPFDKTYGSKEYVWFKCENGIHDDYKKRILDINKEKYICPECAKEKAIANIPRGEESPQWRGGILKENQRCRNSTEYADWRNNVLKKDFYTCQCCGSRENLEVHHINPFSKYKDLRLDVKNGICLCDLHHQAKIVDSFHNLYGTHNNTPEQLEEYINAKRRGLGINIPFSIESYLSGNILTHADAENSKLGTWIFDKYKPSELRKSRFTQMRVKAYI